MHNAHPAKPIVELYVGEVQHVLADMDDSAQPYSAVSNRSLWLHFSTGCQRLR